MTYNNSMEEIYRRLKQKALQLQQQWPSAAFYVLHQRELSISAEVLSRNSLLRECINYLRLEQEGMGHGFEHSKAVAIEAGALVMVDAGRYCIDEEEKDEAIFAVHVAGLLHDIKRGVREHALEGSREASEILQCLGVNEKVRDSIVVAIRNHEAFKETVPLKNCFERIVSDALYDADKFRWGPDNFTTTIWHMLEYERVSPEEFLERYTKGMDYIRRIKETFRTPSGRRYGPEIIEQGLKIGEVIYRELKEALRK